MIQIYHAKTGIIDFDNYELLRDELSAATKLKLDSYRNKKDKLLLLTSMGLLKKMLVENGCSSFSLKDLKYDDYGRPNFGQTFFDFNISHTDDIAAVAFSNQYRVGIDIEKIEEISLSDFDTFFSSAEWDEINSSENKFETFFSHWTRWESVLKADGRGLPLLANEDKHIENDRLHIAGNDWFINHIIINPSISCCVASDSRCNEIVQREVKII